jgi:ATP-dependent Clp endopeptidase proteolytic subunit ClpP
MDKTWFTCEASAESSADIHIYEEIGAWGITAKDFNDSLRALGPVSHIDLYINSPGGSVFDGIGIYNMLKRHKAEITVHVDGIAASIASFIAMVGSKIIMPSNSMMMIHDPSGFVAGTSKDMRELAVALEKMKANMVAAYVAKSGLPEDEVRQMMTDETWMTAQEAVDYGFADEMGQEVQMAALFDLSKYRNAPDVVGTVTNRGLPPPTTEDNMSTAPKGKAETPAEMEARVRAEVTASFKAEADKADEKKDDNDAEDGKDAEARVRAEISEVMAMCDIAGFSNKAADFIQKGLKPSAVLTELQKLRSEGNGGQQTQSSASQLRTGLNAQQQMGTSGHSAVPDKVVDELDPADIWNRWNGKTRAGR